MFGFTKSREVMNVMSRGYEVKEALRAQMEVQSKLHLRVEVCFFFEKVEFVFVLKLEFYCFWSFREW